MVHCNTCYAWQPKDWQGFKWADTVAKCSCKNKFTTHNETCDDGALIAPKGVNKHVAITTIAINASSKSVRAKPAEPNVTGNWDSDAGVYVDDNGTPILRPYQQAAVDYYKSRTAIPLFFTMGTGKSATVLRIAGEKFRAKEIDSLLIVAPNDVHIQWFSQQLPIWLNVPYNVQCLGGRGGSRVTYPFDDDPDFMQVVVVNIDTFSRGNLYQDVIDWANMRKVFIVLDEATSIKNMDAARTQRMLYCFNDVIRKGKTIVSSKKKSPCRAILTGTPVTNGPMDLWAMMEFLEPNYFKRNWYSFQAHYSMYTTIGVNDHVLRIPLTEEKWYEIKSCYDYHEANMLTGCTEDTFNTVHAQSAFEGPYKHADELKQELTRLAPHGIMFKSWEEIAECMPEKNYDPRILIMPPEIRTCYESMKNEYIASYAEHTATALNKMTVMMRLQQISSGFLCDKALSTENSDTAKADGSDSESVVSALYGITSEEDDLLPDEIQWIGNSNPKLEALYRDIDELEKPIVIITRFTAEAARIYNDISGKYSTCLVTGWRREGSIDDYQKGKYQIMVANIASVARGFNLQNGHSILFYSNTFSLEMRLQAEGRIFRIGQQSACLYGDYCYEDSIDEKVIASLLIKRNLLDFIRRADVKELVA